MSDRAPGARPRWPYFGPAQKLLVGCGFAIWIGVALPWVILPPVDIYLRVSPLTVSWLLWAGLMTLAGGIAPWRPAALASAVGGGGTAVYLAMWQTQRLLQRCGLSSLASLDCLPGPGLLLAFGAGALALWQAWRILRPAPGSP